MEIKRSYKYQYFGKCKIDNHEIEIDFNFNQKNSLLCKIFWCYSNNLECTDFFFNWENQKFTFFHYQDFLTKRQKKILIEKIEKSFKLALKLYYKDIEIDNFKILTIEQQKEIEYYSRILQKIMEV